MKAVGAGAGVRLRCPAGLSTARQRTRCAPLPSLRAPWPTTASRSSACADRTHSATGPMRAATASRSRSPALRRTRCGVCAARARARHAARALTRLVHACAPARGALCWPQEVCDNCRCFLCESTPAECPQWGEHCHATDTEPKWIAQKKKMARRKEAAAQAAMSASFRRPIPTHAMPMPAHAAYAVPYPGAIPGYPGAVPGMAPQPVPPPAAPPGSSGGGAQTDELDEADEDAEEVFAQYAPQHVSTGSPHPGARARVPLRAPHVLCERALRRRARQVADARRALARRGRPGVRDDVALVRHAAAAHVRARLPAARRPALRPAGGDARVRQPAVRDARTRRLPRGLLPRRRRGAG